MRLKKEYTLICIEEKCGKEFIAHSKNAKRCPACRLERQRLAAQEKYRLYGHRRRTPIFIETKMTIEEVVSALTKYNKEHGTRYTYGIFVSLLERGIIHVGEN